MNDDTLVPQHVGIIMDGNRRWARERGLPVWQGHLKGRKTIHDVAIHAFDRGVKYLTLYAFSTENWQRPKDEIAQLMKIFLWMAKHETRELQKRGVRLRVIGSRLKLGKALLKAIHEAEELTKDNTRGTLLICLDYGGQQEIVEAVKQLAARGVDPADITAEMIGQYLYAPEVPPIDLLVRTSGEQRLSNFMLWRAAYSELMFTDVQWPDFTGEELDTLLDRYTRRQRRFGK